MDSLSRQLLAALHQAPYQCVLALAGGGTTTLGMLLTVPGGSRTVLEASVPYSEAAFCEFLGRTPEQFCSAETSLLLAERAFQRACWLAPLADVVGVGCTATLATDRPKRGDHRCHVTVCGPDAVARYTLNLAKGMRDRAGEEAVVDAVLLNALAESFGLTERAPLPFLPGDHFEVVRHSPDDLITQVSRGQCDAVCVEPDGQLRVMAPQPHVLLPGAFNPVHLGHWELAALAARRTGQPVAFELSVLNVDKPPLNPGEIRHRLAAFQGRACVWVTRAPTFREKAARFPGTVFVIGADTAARIIHPRYYGHSAEHLLAALDAIRHSGCRFLVGGREDEAGRFVLAADLAIPSSFADLFESVPESEFRVPGSSTLLRTQPRGVASVLTPP